MMFHRRSILLLLFLHELSVQHVLAACGDPGEAFFNDNGMPQGGATAELRTAVFCLYGGSNCDSTSLAPAARGSSVTDSSNAALFYGPNVTNFCVEKVTDFSQTFGSLGAFNLPLLWDMSSATTMREMFAGATSFNQDISSWNVAKVLDFSYTFALSGFNIDISPWNVGNGVSFFLMFDSAQRFLQDLSSWNISSGCDFTRMFYNIPLFNFDMNAWGPKIAAKDCSGSAPITTIMFLNTACPGPDTPVLGAYCQFAPPSSSPSQPPSQQPSALPTKSYYARDYIKANADKCSQRIFVLSKCNCLDPRCIESAFSNQCKFTFTRPKDRKDYQRLLQVQIRKQCLILAENRQRTSVPTFTPSAKPSPYPTISLIPSSPPSQSAKPSSSIAPSKAPSAPPMISAKAAASRCFQRIFFVIKCRCTNTNCIRKTKRQQCKFAFATLTSQQKYKRLLQQQIEMRCGK